MTYMYDAVHNSIKFVDDAEDDAFDSRGILKDGKKIRVPVMMRDSATVDGDSDRSRREAYDYAKAELFSRYKGGLSDDDTFRLGDRMVTVSGRNPENGKLQLREVRTATSTQDGRAEAYVAYDADVSSRYLGDKPDQVEPAGPLSDEQRVQAKDQMYQNYDAELAQRWRRK